MSKAIYKPKGKAGEYAEWACNLYVGCSNDCDYCYCKRGVLAHAMGGPVPKLKACFRDKQHAFEVFVKELDENIEAIRQSSLFFTFSSDPMILETRYLNLKCIDYAIQRDVKCQVLTKNADFIRDEALRDILIDRSGMYRRHLAFGFTLTGRDDMEPGASSNYQRVDAMARIKLMGFRTFASLEPVVDPVSTCRVLLDSEGACDLYKVGLMSGRSLSAYNRGEVERLVAAIQSRARNAYFKKSLTDYLGLPAQEPIDIFKIEL